MSGKWLQSHVRSFKANLNTHHLVRLVMTSSEWAVLVEDNGKTYVVELQDKQQKIKGLGVFNPFRSSTKSPLVVMRHRAKRGPPCAPRLPELSRGMVREPKRSEAKMRVFS